MTYDMAKILADMEAAQAARKAAAAQVLAANKAIMFPVLDAAGIETIEVTYDGCGDAGSVDNVACTGASRSIELPSAETSIQSLDYYGNIITETLSIADALETWCLDLIALDHSGWENNDGAFGTFTFTVHDQSIEHEHNARFTDYACHSYSY